MKLSYRLILESQYLIISSARGVKLEMSWTEHKSSNILQSALAITIWKFHRIRSL